MELHDDDKPVGRVLSRREVLKLLGGASAIMVAGTSFSRLFAAAVTPTPTPGATATAIPACVVKPEMTEGPYFVDELLNRSDIRIEPSDGSVKPGVLLNLIFNVYDITDQKCAPLKDVQVDVWQCDALGTYSDIEESGFNTVGQKFLRGYQITDEDGVVKFITIYPGWYSGRTVHIHFKIRTDPTSDTGYEFTSQLYFDDTITDQIHALEPYNEKGTDRDTRNDNDMHYANGGDQMLLTLETIEEGYSATFSIGLDLNDADAGDDDSFSMSGGPSGGGGAPGGNPPNGTPPAGGPGARPTATPSPTSTP